jgi:maltooligosyltrehalose trehalohydrolase
VEVKLIEPAERVVELAREGEEGYFSAAVEGVGPGALYVYRLHRGDGEGVSDAGVSNAVERPDPASRHQPRGVHGPSVVVAREHPWKAVGWTGLALAEHVF